MFSTDNTDGFTADEINLCNEAAARLVSENGLGEREAQERVSNNWQESDNTVESLIR